MIDRNAAARYLRENFEEEERLAIVLIDRLRNEVEQKFVSVEQACADKYQAHLRAANASGRDIYVAMNPVRPGTRGRTKSDIARVAHTYLDIDKDGLKTLERLRNTPGMPPPHHALQTSPDKVQVVWRVSGFTPTQAEAMMKSYARAFSADPAATDVSRVLRVPNFRNHKYPDTPHYVRDITASVPDKKVYTPSDFPSYVPRPQEPPIATPRFGERATRSLDSTVDRSTQDYAYALRQLEKGESPDYIRNKIADFRRPDGKHPNVEDYARRTVNAAQRHYSRISFRSVSTESSEDRSSGMER